jgi:hypothetical protein
MSKSAAVSSADRIFINCFPKLKTMKEQVSLRRRSFGAQAKHNQNSFFILVGLFAVPAHAPFFSHSLDCAREAASAGS